MPANRALMKWVDGPEEGQMIVTTTCPMCGYVNAVVVTEEQLDKLLDGDELIQNTLPKHPREEREKLITGYCSECQKKIFDRWCLNEEEEKEEEDSGNEEAGS